MTQERLNHRSCNHHSLAQLGATSAFLVLSLILSGVSLASTSETGCGPILSPTPGFGWDSRDLCGIAHRGTLIEVAALFITAGLMAATLIGRPRRQRRIMMTLTAGLACANFAAAVWSTLRMASAPEVLQVGWEAVSKVTWATGALATLGTVAISRSGPTRGCSGQPA